MLRTACLSEATNTYFDAVQDDVLNWRAEVIRAVGTDTNVFWYVTDVGAWDVVNR
jgi:hypothetical protein